MLAWIKHQICNACQYWSSIVHPMVIYQKLSKTDQLLVVTKEHYTEFGSDPPPDAPLSGEKFWFQIKKNVQILISVRTSPVPGSGPGRSMATPDQSRIFFWTSDGPCAACLRNFFLKWRIWIWQTSFLASFLSTYSSPRPQPVSLKCGHRQL